MPTEINRIPVEIGCVKLKTLRETTDDETKIVVDSIVEYFVDNGIFAWNRHYMNGEKTNEICVNAGEGLKIIMLYLFPHRILIGFNAMHLSYKQKKILQYVTPRFLGEVNINDPDSYSKLLKIVKKALNEVKDLIQLGTT